MSETQVVVLIDLDRLCEEMVKALPELDCPDCCGPVYKFIEDGSAVYLEELHWAHLCGCLMKKKRAA